MKTLKYVFRTVLTSIPGSALNTAAAKRKMEQELRASGLSLKAAKQAVSERFLFHSAVADTTTGTLVSYVPEGPDRDALLGLVRLGLQFQQHQKTGKKPGYLANLIFDCAKRAGPPYSFDQLLFEFNRLAAQRESDGGRASPIEKVSRSYQLVTLHIPKKGRVQVPFETLRNHLTAAKKRLAAQFPLTAKP